MCVHVYVHSTYSYMCSYSVASYVRPGYAVSVSLVCIDSLLLLEMAECDVNYMKDADLLPLKHSTSKVWKFFRFKHEGGVITDHSYVSQDFWLLHTM